MAEFTGTFTDSLNYAQKISAEERKIVDFVDVHVEDAIALLEKTVNVESPTENLTGVKAVGTIFKQEFESLGFDTRWIEMPAEMMRAGHLIAEKSGTKGKRLLLLGHLDTVLKGEKFRREGDTAYGSGVYDMKAGVVVMCYALKAMQAAGLLKGASIIAMLTGDEENAGTPKRISRADLIAAAERCDLALGFEFGRNNFAIAARRGSCKWQLEVEAKSGHSSLIFSENVGSGAVFEAARIVNEFYETLHNEEYLTFNPSLFGAGTEIETEGEAISVEGKANVVSAKAIVRGDLRFISEEQKEAAMVKMREIVAANLPATRAEIIFNDGIPAMPPTDGNYALLELLNEVSQDLDLGRIEPFDPGERGAGDISYIAHLISGVDALGAAGGNAHVSGEYADLATLPDQIKRAAVLIYRLIQQDS